MLTFSGKYFFKSAICVVGTIAITMLLSLFLFSVFFSRDSSHILAWVVFIICLAIGVCAGIVLAALTRLGVGVLAAWGGFCLGLILYNAFLYKVDNDSKVAFWSTTISLAVVAAILTLAVFNMAIIVSTSIVGSYSLMRGISMYAGGFPDEMELYYLIKMHKLSSVNGTFYIYFVFFIVMAVLGSLFQFKKFSNSHHKSYERTPHPYHR